MKKNHKIKACLFFAVLAMGVLGIGKMVSEHIKNNLKDNVIRFHVRANSDSKKDQTDKLKVRDAVIEYMGPYMEQAQSKEKAVKILEEQKEEIKKTAIHTLRNLGNNSQVNVYFTTEVFPEKDYGQYCFPEGIYDAIRIDIGKAKGHNWWCVMFPDLCITKDDKVKVNQKAKDKMERILGERTVKAIEKNKYLRWFIN